MSFIIDPFRFGSVSYASVLQNTYGFDEIWPLVDISAGTTITAFINSARNGTLTGWDLQNAAGPVSGTNAPYSDGANDFGNIYTSNGTTGLADIFNGGEFSVIAWFNATALANSNYLLDLFVDNSNRLAILGANSTTIRATYVAGGTTKTGTATCSTGSWYMIGVTASATDDAYNIYLNNTNPVTASGLGTFAGSLNSTLTCIGARDTGPTSPFNGLMAYVAVKFGHPVITSANMTNIYNAASTSGAD